MTQVSVHVRLRPIRFGFLVRPDDYESARAIFEINTCLWGGKYNPIIPSLKRVPKWWDRHDLTPETAEQIVNGYLDFFEPDFIVEAEPGLASGLGFNSERVLQLPNLLTREGHLSASSHGLSVLGLYRSLYRKEFQFTRRHEHDIIHVVPETSKFRSFCACVFGAFPTEQELSYFAQGFRDAFEPKEISLAGSSLANLYLSGFTSALRIGHSGLTINYNNRDDPSLFVLNAFETRDLIDYWNLRAAGHSVVPVPVQWIEELGKVSREIIVGYYRPLPGNSNGVMTRVTVMFSRSIPATKIERLHADCLTVDVADANVRQDFYPPFWRRSPGFTRRETRPNLSAAEETFDSTFTADMKGIRFGALHPDFADEDICGNRWANVVRLQDWTYKGQVATVFPSNYKSPDNRFPRFRMGLTPILSTTEGLIHFPESSRLPEYWSLMDGTTAIKDWLEAHSISAVLSDAGRATQQIIQALDGFWGVASLASGGVVKILNGMSRTLSRSAHHHQFKNQIRDAVKNEPMGWRSFENLVERNVVELGLELKCTKCSSWNWYALRQLDYQMSCALCLKQFRFPITEPSEGQQSRWAYRLIGPFSLPDYAKGGYSASLAVRFFSETLGRHSWANVTWSAGQELRWPEGTVESDFILWYQRQGFRGHDFPVDIVFGEAKSFGRDVFGVDDVQRMKALAVKFPGAILVFATMKQADEFSRDEIARIAKLALWGREYIKEKKTTRAPVIVLTGTELFAPLNLRDAWMKIGDAHARLIEPGWVRVENLRILADLTQQLYLNLPSYDAWLQTRWQARASRRRTPKGADGLV